MSSILSSLNPTKNTLASFRIPFKLNVFPVGRSFKTTIIIFFVNLFFSLDVTSKSDDSSTVT